MATFFNQATLSYDGNTINSNIVTGEIVRELSAAKTAVVDTYRSDGEITYIISLVNSGSTTFSNLTVTDNLGAYSFGTDTLVPLTYVEDSVKYYVNGVLQAAPAVSTTPDLEFSGINVPASGNAIIVYAVRVNEFAPLGTDGAINNEISVNGDLLAEPIVAEETVNAFNEAELEITKSLSPQNVPINGQLTYTFVISNSGNVSVPATSNAVVTDVFDPILSDIVVVLNGTTLTSPDNYTYNEATGEFATVPGVITVPAATQTQNPETGIWTTIPAESTLTVTGRI